MKITVLTKDELTREEIDSLWKQDVSMDDVDYIIICDKSTLVNEFLEKTRYDPYIGKQVTTKYDIYKQLDSNIANILDRLSVCSGIWHIAKFRGRKRAIGIAYHS